MHDGAGRQSPPVALHPVEIFADAARRDSGPTRHAAARVREAARRLRVAPHRRDRARGTQIAARRAWHDGCRNINREALHDRQAGPLQGGDTRGRRFRGSRARRAAARARGRRRAGRCNFAEARRDPGAQARRQGRSREGRPDVRRCARRRLRRGRAAGWRRQRRRDPDAAGRARIRDGGGRCGQADCRDLSRRLAARIVRAGGRPHDDELAEPAGRHPQRGRQVGRPGGRARRQPDHEPQARRSARIQRRAGAVSRVAGRLSDAGRFRPSRDADRRAARVRRCGAADALRRRGRREAAHVRDHGRGARGPFRRALRARSRPARRVRARPCAHRGRVRGSARGRQGRRGAAQRLFPRARQGGGQNGAGRAVSFEEVVIRAAAECRRGPAGAPCACSLTHH
ncbi:hypothetical protein BDI4_1090016 [Burkholderia diffusa]|nr:hypothetical protein BDI4_1090016 [Burkholderia diffusa]